MVKKEPTFKELMDHINGAAENGKANSSIGLFISEYFEETSKEIDNFIVKKPVVNISSFVEDNELYYTVSFLFKSYNDADYKQMWRFLCDYINKAKRERDILIKEQKELEKVSVLSVSIVPEKYNGKYFAYINMPFIETFSRVEDAFEGSATISFVCNDEGFGLLSSDDDMIDRRTIEREAEQELLNETESVPQ